MESTFKLQNYIINSKYIGKGAFSKVYKGYKITESNIEINNNVVAIKAINKSKLKSGIINRIESEISILKQVDHPNILKLLEVIYTENYIFIVTELCQGTLDTLQSIVVSEKNIMIQIKNGIEYLYNNKIYHRDLKLQNILYKITPSSGRDDIQIKICDFGFAKIINTSENLNQTLCGTPYYLAPEILINHEYNDKSDLWSIGCIYYYIVYKKLPYSKSRNILELIKNINDTELMFPDTISCELNYVDIYSLLKKLLEKNPINRLTWNEFFNHDFFIQQPIGYESLSNSILDEDMNLSNINIGDESMIINMKKNLLKNKPTVIKNIKNINVIDNYIQNNPNTFTQIKTSPVIIHKSSSFSPPSLVLNVIDKLTPTINSSIETINTSINNSIETIKTYLFE